MGNLDAGSKFYFHPALISLPSILMLAARITFARLVKLGNAGFLTAAGAHHESSSQHRQIPPGPPVVHYARC